MLFADLSMEVRTWAKAMHQDYAKLMDQAEKDVGEFLTVDNVDLQVFPDFAEMDGYLWRILVGTVKGDAKAYLKCEAESGFQAWSQMTQHFDPRGSVDRTVAYQRISNPVPFLGQAKDATQARLLMQRWESETAQYERKFKTVDTEAKMLGLKSIMPSGMFGESGACRGIVH